MGKPNEQIIPGCKVMSKDGFWNLIAEVKAASGQDQEKHMDMLKARLKELGPEYAQDFHDIVHAYEDLANKYGLWSASELMGLATDDSFIDFRAWLISQGKEAYFSALNDPDTMADLDPGDGYWFESFTYAEDSVLEELTGESAYDHTDRAAYAKIVEALKDDIDYGEGINYPYESEEIADYFPRLYERYLHSSGEFIYEGSWNYNDPEIAEARRSGPPPKPQKTMEMIGRTPEQIKAAEVLYVLALSEYAKEPGFVAKLAGCFADDQTDEQLIAEVNAAFGTNLDPEDFSAIMNYANHQLVEVAKSQLGNIGGEPYWSWYGFGGRVEWCACFVSWCANQCGYIDRGIIPKFAGCGDGVDWFKAKGQWLDGSGTPAPGNIIFFDWPDDYGVQDGNSDHVGIVEKVEGGRVYTIEGNSGDACERNSYPVGNYQILGYGTPNLL